MVDLLPVDSIAFVREESKRMAPSAVKAAANALRSFLRFGGNVLGAYMMSDERLKEDIEPIGELHDGQEPLPIYEWSYKGDPERHIGPMAQDLAETNPELVHEHPSDERCGDR